MPSWFTDVGERDVSCHLVLGGPFGWTSTSILSCLTSFWLETTCDVFVTGHGSTLRTCLPPCPTPSRWSCWAAGPDLVKAVLLWRFCLTKSPRQVVNAYIFKRRRAVLWRCAPSVPLFRFNSDVPYKFEQQTVGRTLRPLHDLTSLTSPAFRIAKVCIKIYLKALFKDFTLVFQVGPLDWTVHCSLSMRSLLGPRLGGATSDFAKLFKLKEDKDCLLPAERMRKCVKWRLALHSIFRSKTLWWLGWSLEFAMAFCTTWSRRQLFKRVFRCCGSSTICIGHGGFARALGRPHWLSHLGQVWDPILFAKPA